MYIQTDIYYFCYAGIRLNSDNRKDDLKHLTDAKQDYIPDFDFIVSLPVCQRTDQGCEYFLR